MTKPRISLYLLLTTSCLLISPALPAETLLLRIHGIASEQGNVVIQVYSERRHWLSDNVDDMALRMVVDAAEVKANPEVSLALPYGRYAIQVFHDLDGNDQLNASRIGIPREPVGTSNNARARMGPPRFNAASFEFSAEQSSHDINMVDI